MKTSFAFLCTLYWETTSKNKNNMIYIRKREGLYQNTQLHPNVGENGLMVIILTRWVFYFQRAKSLYKKLNKGYLTLLDNVIDQIVSEHTWVAKRHKDVSERCSWVLFQGILNELDGLSFHFTNLIWWKIKNNNDKKKKQTKKQWNKIKERSN